MPEISLVVPAYNEAALLGRTLGAVEEARAACGDPSADEVIVVDNQSTDRTAEIARACGATVAHEHRPCIAVVRNTGARAASGRVLAFTDADGLVSRHVFARMLQALSSGRCVGGSMGVRLERMSPGLFVTMCLTVYPAEWLLGVSGGLYFVDRVAFCELGGFDERLYCAEDSSFLLALRRYARRSRKKLVMLKGVPTITSARSFDRFGDRYCVRNVPRIVLHGGVRLP